MSRRRALVIVALVIAVVIFVTWWRTGLKQRVDESLRPRISVAAVSIRDIDSERLKLDSRIVIHNPSPVKLTSKRIYYELFINKKKILESAYEKTVTINAKDSSSLELPMEVLVKPLVKLLKNLESKDADSADYSLRTRMVVDLPVKGETELAFDFNRRLPSYRVPKIHPEDLDFNKIAWKESKMKMVFVVYNPNIFPLKIKDVTYDVKLADDLALRGENPGVISIPPESTMKVPIYLTMTNPEMVKLVSKTLVGKGEAAFSIDFTGDLMSKNEILRGSKIAMHVGGTVKELREVLKARKERRKADAGR